MKPTDKEMDGTPHNRSRLQEKDLARSPSDRSLILRFRAGDETAAAILFGRYAKRIRNLAGSRCNSTFSGRFDADDIVQSVFRAFFSGVRNSTYDVPPEGELWGLLLVLALNKIRSQVDHHEAAKRNVHRTVHTSNFDARTVADTGDNSSDLFEIILDDLLSGLPNSNREIIRFRIEGYDVKEIASRTGRSRRTVERVLQEFRNRVSQSD